MTKPTFWNSASDRLNQQRVSHYKQRANTTQTFIGASLNKALASKHSILISAKAIVPFMAVIKRSKRVFAIVREQFLYYFPQLERLFNKQ